MIMQLYGFWFVGSTMLQVRVREPGSIGSSILAIEPFKTVMHLAKEGSLVFQVHYMLYDLHLLLQLLDCITQIYIYIRIYIYIDTYTRL